METIKVKIKRGELLSSLASDKSEINKRLYDNLPPMYKVMRVLDKTISDKHLDYDFYFEIERLMDGNQYLLWRV